MKCNDALRLFDEEDSKMKDPAAVFLKINAYLKVPPQHTVLLFVRQKWNGQTRLLPNFFFSVWRANIFSYIAAEPTTQPRTSLR